MSERSRCDRVDWDSPARMFVDAGGVRWHVRTAGAGPTLLLLHGSGSSAHSWRDAIEPLAEHFTLIAPDLPGHGQSNPAHPNAFTMKGMALALSAMLRRMEAKPEMVVGHSAGAALAARMAIDGLIAPKVIIGVNAALMPFSGALGSVYSAIAGLLAINPLVPRAIAWRAGSSGMVRRLLAETGSRIDARGAELYRNLAMDRRHVAATLRMMANWDLPALARDLPRLPVPFHHLVGAKDRTVPPERAFEAQKLMPVSQVTMLPGLGHLAHEEQPDLFCAHVLALARRHGVLSESHP